MTAATAATAALCYSAVYSAATTAMLLRAALPCLQPVQALWSMPRGSPACLSELPAVSQQAAAGRPAGARQAGQASCQMFPHMSAIASKAQCRPAAHL